MKKGILLYFLLLAGIAFGQTVKIPISHVIQTRDGKQYYIHTVQKGQTLYSISKAYHVSLQDIYYANPGTEQGILIGQKLWIPVVNKKPVTKQRVNTSRFDFFYHIASKGETIDHIASIYLIPKRYILLANPGIKSPLKEGEYVKIPVESAFPILDKKISDTINNQQYSGGIRSNQPVPTTVTTEPAIKKNSFKKAVNSGHNVQQTNTTGYHRSLPVIKNFRHVVVAGETLKSIAKKYGITTNELKAVNPGLINVFQGERLFLPVTAKVPGYHPSARELKKARKYEAASEKNFGHVFKNHPVSAQQKKQNNIFTTHIVKKKETLYSISRLYGIKIEDLYQANPGLTTNIRIGQIIKIPKKKISTDFVYYQARQKIPLKKVARLYRIDVSLLFQNNPSIGRKVIPGQVVRIPVGPEAFILSQIAQQAPKQPSGKITPSESEKTVPVTYGGCQPHPHNRTFKVALMVPLYLEQTDSINMTEFMIRQEKNYAPFRFIRFLEGALIASDSLKAQGMNLQLYVYDVDQTLAKTAEVLTHPELKNMNLIIGPFYSRSFSQVALFASHFHIPIVNPLSYRTEILLRYNDVIKVTPDKNVEVSEVSKLIKNEYDKDKVFVISQTPYTHNQIVSALTDSIRRVLPDSVSYPNLDLINTGIAVTQREKDQQRQNKINQNPALADSIPKTQITFNDTLNNYYLENYPVNPEILKNYQFDTTTFPNPLIYTDYARDSLHPFINNASVLRDNLVVLYGDNKSFIMDAMNRLNVLRDTFNIKMIGLPEWQKIGTLSLHQMNNMEVTFPSDYYVDYNSPAYEQFSREFYRRYATSPERYGVLGFDITYYFLRSVYLYGNKFMHCLPKHREKEISTEFYFKPVNTGNNNYENSYWNWLRIKNFQLIKLPDSLTESTSSAGN